MAASQPKTGRGAGRGAPSMQRRWLAHPGRVRYQGIAPMEMHIPKCCLQPSAAYNHLLQPSAADTAVKDTVEAVPKAASLTCGSRSERGTRRPPAQSGAWRAHAQVVCTRPTAAACDCQLSAIWCSGATWQPQHRKFITQHQNPLPLPSMGGPLQRGSIPPAPTRRLPVPDRPWTVALRPSFSTAEPSPNASWALQRETK